MEGMRGRCTDLHLWFYVNVCLDADANVITGVWGSHNFGVTLGCSCLPMSLCSKCLAPVAVGGGSCCQDIHGLLQEWFPTFSEPSSVFCLLVWLSGFGKVKLLSCRRRIWEGAEGTGRSPLGMAPSQVLATDCGHHWGPKSAWFYCECLVLL